MKQIYKKRSFVIYRVRDGHIIYNTKKPFSEGHTHVSNYDTAIRIMNIAISKEIPRHLSDYLLESLIRLTDDENFRIRIENLRENRKKGKGKGENMKLADTVEMMNSADYKERFKAEYAQLIIRYQGLKNLLVKWDNGTLDFEPTCPRSIYTLQIKAMTDYIAVLEARAAIEHIDIEDAIS